MEERQGPEFLRVTIPGMVTRKTISALMGFPEKMAVNARLEWYSLLDDDVRKIFVPKIGIIKQAIRLYGSDESLAKWASELNFKEFEETGRKLPHIDKDVIKETQEAIIQYEINKAKIARREEVKRLDLSWVPVPKYGRLIVVKIPGKIINPEPYVPILDSTSQKIMAAIIGYPDPDTPSLLNKGRAKYVEDNFNVLNTLCGTNYSFQEWARKNLKVI